MTHQKFLDEITRLDKEGEHLKVVQLITEILPANPDESILFFLRAQQLLKMEKFKEGVSDAKRAAELGGGTDAYQLYGRLLFSCNKFVDAKAAFQKGKELRDSAPSGLDPCAQWLDWCEDRIKKLGLTEPSSNTPVSSTSNKCDTNKITVAPAVKHDWYQTDTHTIIMIMIKNAKKDDLTIEFDENTLNVLAKLASGDNYNLKLNFCYPIQPEPSLYKIMSTKIEVKLKKQDCIRWPSLEAESGVIPTKIIAVKNDTTETTSAISYPSSAAKKKDWNKIEADVIEMEKTEKPEGDAALNSLFQKIYSDGSDEVRKAMNKSFSESGGTVLSTNWKEIEGPKVDVKAPDGLEWKKWDK